MWVPFRTGGPARHLGLLNGDPGDSRWREVGRERPPVDRDRQVLGREVGGVVGVDDRVGVLVGEEYLAVGTLRGRVGERDLDGVGAPGVTVGEGDVSLCPVAGGRTAHQGEVVFPGLASRRVDGRLDGLVAVVGLVEVEDAVGRARPCVVLGERGGDVLSDERSTSASLTGL